MDLARLERLAILRIVPGTVINIILFNQENGGKRFL